MTENNEEVPSRKLNEIVYVKKWMRTRHAIMFRLSNKIVQVNFQDHTEIILSSETRVVTYVNKKGERLTYPLSTAMESSNLEMVKRLKYTKDILTHMLNANQAPGSSGGKDNGPLTTGARPKTKEATKTGSQMASERTKFASTASQGFFPPANT